MGWAKYLEDNISICNDRLYMQEYANNHVLVQPAVKRKAVIRPVIEADIKRIANNSKGENTTSSRSRRCGLELRFPVSPEKELVRKLQLNGWWWSNNAGSWCNTDSEANRRYVQDSLRKWNPVLMVS